VKGREGERERERERESYPFTDREVERSVKLEVTRTKHESEHDCIYMYRRRASVAHVRQSRPYSVLDFQA